MAVVRGGVVLRCDSHPALRRRVESFIGTGMLAAAMVVLALVTFAAMLGFVMLCDRV
jgi:hypothetical protein